MSWGSNPGQGCQRSEQSDLTGQKKITEFSVTGSIGCLTVVAATQHQDAMIIPYMPMQEEKTDLWCQVHLREQVVSQQSNAV